MNTTPMISITQEGPEVGEDPELARQRAIKAHTGASVFLPPKVVLEEKPDIETKPSATDEAAGS